MKQELKIGDLVRLTVTERKRSGDARHASIVNDCNDVGGVRLSVDLGGTRFWHRDDLELVTDHVNEYLAQRKKIEGKNAIRAMHFKRGGAMSIQGSESHYCSPKSDTGPYTAVEILVMSPRLKVPKSFGKPREKFDDGSRLFTFVQVSAVNEEIARRGGIA